MKRICVPDGMLKAVHDASRHFELPEGLYFAPLIEAALGWLAENPIVPTSKQLQAIADENGRGRAYPENISLYVTGFQRRMFLAPEPEVPEAIQDLILKSSDEDCLDLHNNHVIEAYRRGMGNSRQARKESK